MSSKSQGNSVDEAPAEVDFSKGIRGKYAEAFGRGYTVVIHRTDGSLEERDYGLPEDVVRLDPDVQAYFPDAKAVNAALRGLIELIPDRQTR